MIYGVVWGIACILYLIHALNLLKKDREAAKNEELSKPDTTPESQDANKNE